jgi:hypothetical protein
VSEELQELIDSNPEWYKDLLLPDVKEFIKDNINSASRSFVAIGYYLKYVRDKELYKLDCYSGILDFAQAEYGISKSWASKWMSINDKFSVNGYSPILLKQYQDFSSSKLTEMLYLTDEQLEQVTITTTKAEIRQIGKPVKEEIETVSFSPAKTEQEPKKPYYECAAYKQYQYSTKCKDCCYDKADCPYDRAGYFEKMKQQEEWKTHCEVLKEMCDCICKMSSYILEKNNYSMETIKSLSRMDQSFSFGFGDDGAGHSKYDARFMTKENRYCVKEFHGEGMWMFEAGEVDQQIWNYNGNTWRFQQHEAAKSARPIDDLDFTVRTYNCLKHAGIDTNEQLCNLTEDEVIAIRNISRKCLDEIKLKLSEIGKCLKSDDIPDTVNDQPDSVDYEPEIVTDVDEQAESDDLVLDCYNSEEGWHKEIVSGEPEEVETVEADIIETLSTETKSPDTPVPSHLELAKEMLKQKQERLREFINVQTDTYADRKYIESRKVEVGALAAFIADLEGIPEPIKPVQPELPILKNNDQRKEFLEAFETWPLWIDTKDTEEKYYRYDFDNGSFIVVKVYFQKGYSWGELKNKDHWGSNEYYLIKSPESHFKDCQTNMSALIEYLKDLQKKGA